MGYSPSRQEPRLSRRLCDRRGDRGGGGCESTRQVCPEMLPERKDSSEQQLTLETGADTLTDMKSRRFAKQLILGKSSARLAALTAVIVAGRGTASGQITLPGPGLLVPTPAVTVPLAECAGCVPRDICCVAKLTGCTRTDSPPIITHPGFPRLVSASIECPNYCDVEPPCCRTVAYTCALANALTFTESIQLSFGWTFGIEAQAIRASLESAVGVSQGHEVSVTYSCSVVVPEQTHIRLFADVKYQQGVQAEILHIWASSGFWVGNPNANCVCSIPGPARWNYTPCRTVVSTAIGDNFVAGGCRTPVFVPVPPMIPCH
jgi:hypothetical protein